MTLEEISKKYNVAESSLKTAFPRVQKSIKKKHNVLIIKEGRGKNATYREEICRESDGRAVTMFKEVKEDIAFNKDSLTLVNWNFTVFLAIVTTPMFVFRGSYADFLKYMEIDVNEKNIEFLDEALEDLDLRDLISYTIDKTDNNYFTASLLRKAEKEMEIGINMINKCVQLAKDNNKRSWIPLLKTWLGVQMMVEQEELPLTLKELSAYTGLSEYQLRESMKILKKDRIFRASKVYLNYTRCLGQDIDLNGFYN